MEDVQIVPHDRSAHAGADRRSHRRRLRSVDSVFGSVVVERLVHRNESVEEQVRQEVHLRHGSSPFNSRRPCPESSH